MTGARLLFVLNDARFFISHRLPLAVAALEHGFEVHVAAPFEPVAAAAITAAGCVLHPLPLHRSGRSMMAEWRLIAALRRLYRTIGPRIVHHVTIKPVIYGSLVRRFTGGGGMVNAVPGLGFVFVTPGPAARVLRWAVERSYAVALGSRQSVAIFQNPDDRQLFVDRGMVRPEQTVLIRGSGVDLRQFVPTAEPPGIPLVILPGRMIRDKGVQEFVDAARQLRDSGRVVRFALVGGCDDNPAAVEESTLRAWHDEGVVEWWGRRDDMVTVVRAASIVCLPSYREGVPKALLEAAASGRAIVTTDVPGCREVVTDGVNGLLVPPRDADALAAALAALLDDPDRRRRMGEAGRARAEREFSVEAVVRDTLAIYDRLLAAA